MSTLKSISTGLSLADSSPACLLPFLNKVITLQISHYKTVFLCQILLSWERVGRAVCIIWHGGEQTGEGMVWRRTVIVRNWFWGEQSVRVSHFFTQKSFFYLKYTKDTMPSLFSSYINMFIISAVVISSQWHCERRVRKVYIKFL